MEPIIQMHTMVKYPDLSLGSRGFTFFGAPDSTKTEFLDPDSTKTEFLDLDSTKTEFLDLDPTKTEFLDPDPTKTKLLNPDPVGYRSEPSRIQIRIQSGLDQDPTRTQIRTHSGSDPDPTRSPLLITKYYFIFQSEEISIRKNRLNLVNQSITRLREQLERGIKIIQLSFVFFLY
jgi:hypothetical protein